jgi:hypothetical protein
MEEEHEAKRTYHKLRRERKHYESKLRDLEMRQSERHRSDKEQRQINFYNQRIRELEARHIA